MSETKTTAPKLNEHTLAAAELLNPHFKIAKSGEATVNEAAYKDVVHAHGGTLESQEKAHSIDGHFIAGAVKAFGDNAIAAFKKHPDLQSTSVSIPMSGKNELTLKIERERTYAGMVRSDGTKADDTTKHAVADVKYTVAEANGSAGQLKQAKAYLNHAALEAIAGGGKAKA